MCLAVPGRIVSIRDDRGTRMAVVDFDGITKEICLVYLPEATVDQYVIVHVGFALSIIDEASAQETLTMFRDIGVLEEELGEASEVDPTAVNPTGVGPTGEKADP